MGPYQRTPKEVAIKLLDTQVFLGVRQFRGSDLFRFLEEIRKFCPTNLWRHFFLGDHRVSRRNDMGMTNPLVVSPSFHQGRDNKDVTQQIGAMRINLSWDQMVHPLLAKFFVIPCRPRCIFFCFDRWSVVEFQVFQDIPFKVGERWDSQGKSQKWYQQRNQWLGLTPLRWDTWFLKGVIAQQTLWGLSMTIFYGPLIQVLLPS